MATHFFNMNRTTDIINIQMANSNQILDYTQSLRKQNAVFRDIGEVLPKQATTKKLLHLRTANLLNYLKQINPLTMVKKSYSINFCFIYCNAMIEKPLTSIINCW